MPGEEAGALLLSLLGSHLERCMFAAETLRVIQRNQSTGGWSLAFLNIAWEGAKTKRNFEFSMVEG